MKLESPTELAAEIQTARELLNAGDAAGATKTGQTVLAQAAALGNEYLEAEAHLLLAQVARLLTRFREARDHSERAIELFQKQHDVTNEAKAVSMLAYCASNLGRNDEAVEAALLGVRLAELQPSSPQLAAALNDLGVASFWARSFASAEAAFLKSIELSEQLRSSTTVLLPSMNLACSEAFRLVTERYRSGLLPDTGKHSQHLARVTPLIEAPALAQATGMRVSVQAMWLLMSSVNATWRGSWHDARTSLTEAAEWLAQYGKTTWLDALHAWASAELSWGQGDLSMAQSLVHEMIRIADEIEHEQVAQLGLLLAIQLHEVRGELGASLQAVRQLQQREQRVRVESLASRSQAVQWHLTARQREQEVVDWTQRAWQMEQLSLKDPLTAIANRRGLELIRK